MAQKKRDKKISQGTAVGSRPTRLSYLEKVLISGSFADRKGEQRRRRLATSKKAAK